MEKGKVDRSHYLFDNKAPRALILPLVVEHASGGAGRHGGLDHDRKCRRSCSFRRFFG